MQQRIDTGAPVEDALSYSGYGSDCMHVGKSHSGPDVAALHIWR